MKVDGTGKLGCEKSLKRWVQPIPTLTCHDTLLSEFFHSGMVVETRIQGRSVRLVLFVNQSDFLAICFAGPLPLWR